MDVEYLLEPRPGAAVPPSPHPRFRRSDLWGDQKKLFTSPRCNMEDDELFPNPEGFLQTYEDRWSFISNLAGRHQQSPTVLDLTKRLMSCPEVLRWGVPPQTAARIQTLHLSLHDTEDLLPEWLDVLSSMFFQLEHLFILGSKDNNATTLASPRCSEILRMRRLYILYRLPGLQSIDGNAVTGLERSLARPDTPNGQRVKRNEWLPKESLMDNLDDEEDDEIDNSANENHHPDRVSRRRVNKYRHRHKVSVKHGEVVEVSLQGTVHRIDADPLADDNIEVERRSKKGELKSSSRRHRRVVAPSQEDINDDDNNNELQELKLRRRRHKKSSGPRRQVDEEEEERQQLLLEMESVVSPQHDWSAACGGLTFTYCGNDTKYRSSGLCGRPKLRLQFGRSKKAIGGVDEGGSSSPEIKPAAEKKRDEPKAK